jgi:sugar/nucleoside kinase (ribokinase family)
MGCVGNDFDQVRLKDVAEEAGLNTAYQVHGSLHTGRCAILVNTTSQ